MGDVRIYKKNCTKRRPRVRQGRLRGAVVAFEPRDRRRGYPSSRSLQSKTPPKSNLRLPNGSVAWRNLRRIFIDSPPDYVRNRHVLVDALFNLDAQHMVPCF
jgi:hypothetical protein